MKKITFLFLISFSIISCTSLDKLLELKVNNDLTESVTIHVPKTSGTAVSFDLSQTADLNSGDFAKYAGKIKTLKINKLTYKFKDFTGNAAGTIPTGTLKFDTITLGTFTNFKISEAANAGTVFTIADASVLNQIETILLNNNSVAIKLKGSVLSEAGSMDFKVEVFMNMTATVKD